ncbi:MAG TPA: glycosyltransferase family 2 protein [Tepidisphaeraceae bacterium]
MPVSVMVPTLNEAANLPRCLDHLRWADEIVVIDSGSKDQTCEIARAYGARVVDFRWNRKWPKKRGWALSEVDFKYPWVLMVDADEWIMPDLAREIAGVIQSDEHLGYYINRKFIFMGRWIKHCGYYPSWNLRLLRRGYGQFERLSTVDDTGSGDNEVHEHVAVHGSTGYLKYDMLHLAYPTVNSFMEKHNRYSNWEALVQYKKAQSGHDHIGHDDLSNRRRLKELSRQLPMRPALRFLYSYIYKLGFLDGYAGLTFCRLLATYEFLSVVKYKELKRADADARAARQLSDMPEFDWKAHLDEAAAVANEAGK